MSQLDRFDPRSIARVARRRATDRVRSPLGWQAPPRMIAPTPLDLAPDPDGYGWGRIGPNVGSGHLTEIGGASITMSLAMQFGPLTFGSSSIFRIRFIVGGAAVTNVSFGVIYAVDPYGVDPVIPSFSTYLNGVDSTGTWSLPVFNARGAANGWTGNTFTAGYVWEGTFFAATLSPGTHTIEGTWPNTINLGTTRKVGTTLWGSSYAPLDTAPTCDQLPFPQWTLQADPADQVAPHGTMDAGGAYNLNDAGVARVSIV